MNKQRCTIRLKNHDYSQPGMYSITICTHNHSCLLGNADNGKMVLNDAGKMVEKIWIEIPQYYNGFDIDVFQIMPNHIHGVIIRNVGAGPRARPNVAQSKNVEFNNSRFHNIYQLQNKNDAKPFINAKKGRPQGVAPTPQNLKLSDVIGRFKTLTTKRYIDGINQHNWKPFTGKLWQRGYYDHIIRNNNELNHARKYINNNPKPRYP